MSDPIAEFNALRDRDKWDAWKQYQDKWLCKHCGAHMDEDPCRASPFGGCSIVCGNCDGELTRRTPGGQSDPFGWKLADK